MATITLEYNSRNLLATKTVEFIKSLGVFKIKEREEKYNPAFVKMIKERAAGPKVELSRSEIREIMGL